MKDFKILKENVLEICTKCNLENFDSIEEAEQNSLCLKKFFDQKNIMLEIRIGDNYYNNENYDFMLIRENFALDQITEKEFENLNNLETIKTISKFLDKNFKIKKTC